MQRENRNSTSSIIFCYYINSRHKINIYSKNKADFCSSYLKIFLPLEENFGLLEYWAVGSCNPPTDKSRSYQGVFYTLFGLHIGYSISGDPSRFIKTTCVFIIN